ncbi:hypothetical protein Dsin_008539 [Dipteronia sinensis]|uniref:DDE Tnp4 domain-containing protein n=1 Tax=Dipteronia sinensis TaxID=43782 RepID=A0AAE0EB13_9ROSI|nr:hypothetical protein Dsin_008539 [Dipteronia sinensis]
MAVCDFNMCFTFAWAGWEGTAHDTRIFLEALRREDLHFPHSPTGQYKGERYHLPDFRCGNYPRGQKELFNYVHSSLRCTIERTFGVWKNRWKILRQMPKFPFNKQVKIVISSMVLHNFIRLNAKNDEESKPYDDDEEVLHPNEEEMSEEQDSRYGPNIGALQKREMDKERERIAILLMQQ